MTIQAQILDLLRELNARLGMAIMLISHDLGVVARVRRASSCTRARWSRGRTEALLADPKHPYTLGAAQCGAALDRDTPGEKRLTTIEGTPPDPLELAEGGCRFAPAVRSGSKSATSIRNCCRGGGDGEARCWVTQAGTELPMRANSVVPAKAGTRWRFRTVSGPRLS